jgi:3D (Asp-Asp-Asp) domain-containing protein
LFFFLLDWQKEQCEARGVEIKIKEKPTTEKPAEEKPKEIVKTTTEKTEQFVARLTAYSSDTWQTDSRPTEMASGKEVYFGAIACPSRYEFGTKVGFDDKLFTCEDRMAKRYRDGNNFDIWMYDTEDALDYGVKYENVTVYLK